MLPLSPQYDLVLEEIDELVGALFVAASRNPKAYFGMAFRPEAKEFLLKHNVLSAEFDNTPAPAASPAAT
jgi:hypothetical protein